jgi:aspartyl-tRNA synthetase
MERATVEAFYRRYIDRCNAHAFGGLGEFVADDVRVNDVHVGLAGYIAGLEAMARAFPDFHWHLRHLLVDGSWIAAHFADTGTHRETGRGADVQEFALYRLADGRIAEMWGDLPEVEQLTG